MQLKTIIALSLSSALALPFAGIAQADDADIGFAAKVGTLGLGAELSLPVSPTTAFRAGINGFSYEQQESFGGIDYDFALDLRSASLLLDWHPTENGFRIGGGVIYNGNEGQATANIADTYRIGGFDFTAAQVGNLTADVSFGEFSPYVGLGWDGSFGDNQRFGLSLELGVLYHGSPRVGLVADGDLSGDPLFQAELAAELADLASDVSEYEYYPVGSIGLSYRF